MLDLGVRYSPETLCQCAVSLSKTLHPLLSTGSTQETQAPSLPWHKSSLPYPFAFVVAKILKVIAMFCQPCVFTPLIT